jgi:hypothetical protein
MQFTPVIRVWKILSLVFKTDAPERNDIAMYVAGFAFVLLVIMAPDVYRTYKSLSETDFDELAETSTTVLERTTFATPNDRKLTNFAFAAVPLFFAVATMLCMAFATSLVATGWIAFREYTLPSQLQDESPSSDHAEIVDG